MSSSTKACRWACVDIYEERLAAARPAPAYASPTPSRKVRQQQSHCFRGGSRSKHRIILPERG
eukprot:9014879-Alexandrium_andersonii.AAC.1